MKTFIVLVLIAGVYAQENVKIETTKKSPIACTRTAKMGDRVSVQYVLSLENGEEIDTSLDKDRPLTITLGQGQVIKGFEQGILGMCFAEERRVTIPPHLGYGDKVDHHQHEIFINLLGFNPDFVMFSFAGDGTDSGQFRPRFRHPTRQNRIICLIFFLFEKR